MSEAEPEQTHEKVEDSAESITETKSEAVPEQNSIDATLFGVRTTGGQEKVVLRLLETKMKNGELNIQSILLVDNLFFIFLDFALTPISRPVLGMIMTSNPPFT